MKTFLVVNPKSANGSTGRGWNELHRTLRGWVGVAHLLLLALQRFGEPRLGLGLPALPVAALTPRGAVPLAVGSHLAGAGRSSRALVRHRRLRRRQPCPAPCQAPARARRGRAGSQGFARRRRSRRARLPEPGRGPPPARSGRRAGPPAARAPQRRYPLHAPPRGSPVPTAAPAARASSAIARKRSTSALACAARILFVGKRLFEIGQLTSEFGQPVRPDQPLRGRCAGPFRHEAVPAPQPPVARHQPSARLRAAGPRRNRTPPPGGGGVAIGLAHRRSQRAIRGRQRALGRCPSRRFRSSAARLQRRSAASASSPSAAASARS